MERDPTSIICQLVILFLAVGIHEYAHCKFADLAGDPTPRYYGRVTLNLFKHLDPLGSIMMVFTVISGFGIGWGKPAPMDPSKMGNPRWDFFIAVLAGPLSNFCQAVLYAFTFRLVFSHPLEGTANIEVLHQFLQFGVLINVSLMFFNLIPFGILDGHYLLGLLMPERPREKWFLFNQRLGFMGLIIIVIALNFPPIGAIVELPIIRLAQFLLGPET